MSSSMGARIKKPFGTGTWNETLERQNAWIIKNKTKYERDPRGFHPENV
jgi:hypothetical protein